MDSDEKEMLSEIRDSMKRLEGVVGRIDSRVGSLDSRVGSLDSRVGSLDSRLGSLDSRVGSLDSRLETVDDRLKFVERRWATGYEELSQKIDGIETRLGERIDAVTTELIALGQMMSKYAQHTDGRVKNHETRITALEKRGRR